MPCFFEPGEEEVPHLVRVDRSLQAGFLGVAGDDLPDAAVCVLLLLRRLEVVNGSPAPGLRGVQGEGLLECISKMRGRTGEAIPGLWYAAYMRADKDHGRYVMDTASGVRFELDAPRPEDIRIEDAANGFSGVCRMGAQAREFFSVARHALLVCRLVEGSRSADSPGRRRRLPRRRRAHPARRRPAARTGRRVAGRPAMPVRAADEAHPHGDHGDEQSVPIIEENARSSRPELPTAARVILSSPTTRARLDRVP